MKSDLSSGIRITPNPANNTIVIRATPSVYRKILMTLRQIDSQAVQVMINTTIAEVSLNDNLRYGVQAYFKGRRRRGRRFQRQQPSASPVFSRAEFLHGGAGDPEAMIDALSKVTKVQDRFVAVDRRHGKRDGDHQGRRPGADPDRRSLGQRRPRLPIHSSIATPASSSR